ncbi:sensor histidine kinase [Roseobacter sp. EG26]|uniref:sensor histidine kinase n=1 Tax=Roseobacter sp. EG26 TaxID=3412477 RepID=UPI003CE54DA8
MVVGSAFALSGLLLIGIVKAGGRTIEVQRAELKAQLAASEQLAIQNDTLRKRAITANQRATAQTEQTIRRVGSDLHDGPAQHLSFAALRLDSGFGKGGATDIRNEIRSSLDKALEEIRAISRGLALPELEELDVAGLVRRAVTERETQSGLSVDLRFEGSEPKTLSYAEKLCIYRFLQEGLSNAFRHGKIDAAVVTVIGAPECVRIIIEDAGEGFDFDNPVPLDESGGQGLIGLKDRAESIGGTLNIKSSIGKGTVLALEIATKELT